MVKLQIKREAGRLYMYVDARGLHDILDAVGARTSGDMYLDRPNTSISVANSTFRLSTETLLKKEYPVKYDLTAVYTTPPTLGNLQTLRDSGFEQVRKILEHYQPIDISLVVQKKLVGG